MDLIRKSKGSFRLREGGGSLAIRGVSVSSNGGELAMAAGREGN
jgi:hypothetical protein